MTDAPELAIPDASGGGEIHHTHRDVNGGWLRPAVFGAMDGLLDLVLDGGHVTGAGATTVDVTEPYWRVIKEGAVPEKEIAEVLKGA